MRSSPGLEILGSRAFIRPQGQVSKGELADILTIALEQASRANATDVLVNITAMTGFDSPGPAYRRWMVRRWKKTLGPNTPLAIVARHEHICPEKTGLLIAAEEGLRAYISESEAEALAWLDASNSSRL